MGPCIDVFERLPDELLLRVISLLPFKEAVCTCLLSTRWKYVYVSMPKFRFKFEEGIKDMSGFVNFVDKLFSLRNGCVVDELCLSKPVSSDIQPLKIERRMRGLMWDGIRELSLIAPFAVMLPASLFTSGTLEVLKLDVMKEFKSSDSCFEVPAKVSLPRLKVLHLYELYFSDSDSLNRMVSSCPVLKTFYCHLRENDCNLSVFSTTLKRLSIQYLCSKTWSGSFNIVVNAPNLEFLQYTAWGVTSQTIVVGATLVKAFYNFRQRYGDCSHYIPNATALLRSISSIRKLSVRESILNSLLKHSIPLPVFGNLTHLTVDRCKHGLRSLPNFLARCGSLEVLDLLDVREWDLGPWIQLEESTVSCLSSRLKKINFFGFVPGEDQIEVVEYFLISARALKRMKIRLSEKVDYRLEAFRLNKLLRLPRVSKKCKVSLLEQNGTPINETF